MEAPPLPVPPQNPKRHQEDAKNVVEAGAQKKQARQRPAEKLWGGRAVLGFERADQKEFSWCEKIYMFFNLEWYTVYYTSYTV